MKKSLAPLFVSLLALLVAGCESSGIQSRIQEKSVVFNNLAPWQQRDIQEGVINVGYSTDMVYMALGKPSKIVTSANGQDTVWTYNNFYPPTARSMAQISLNTSTSGSSPTSGGHVESANAPRSGKSLSDTRGGAQTNLDVPDLPSDTLYVTFRNGQVFQSQLESEK